MNPPSSSRGLHPAAAALAAAVLWGGARCAAGVTVRLEAQRQESPFIGAARSPTPRTGDIVWRETLASCRPASVSPNKQRQPLTFIHIPRTGGTAIEECTKGDQLQKWGVQSQDLHGLHRFNHSGNTVACYKQHVPPWLLPEVYEGAETFCAVRNPYERAISQFGFVNAFFGRGNCTGPSMSEVLVANLLETMKRPFGGDCHYLPQAVFVYKADPDTLELDLSVQTCKHVLRSENLEEGFNQLMSGHGYPFALLRPKRGATDSPAPCQALGIADLSEEAKTLIEDIYAMDFRLFGYTRLSQRATAGARRAAA